MYSKELEELMAVAIDSGELSDKKRQILIKRAISEGIDVDEFEMVLDHRLAMIQKELGKSQDISAVKPEEDAKKEESDNNDEREDNQGSLGNTIAESIGVFLSDLF